MMIPTRACYFLRQAPRGYTGRCASVYLTPRCLGILHYSTVRPDANDDARRIFESAVESVLPHQMVKSNLQLQGSTLHVAATGTTYNLSNKVKVVAFGKAVLGMLRATEDILGDRLGDGVASVPFGIQETLRKLGKTDLIPSPQCPVKIVEGARHNIPDNLSWGTALDIKNLLHSANKDDFILTLMSGGGSALLPSPIPPITLPDLSQTTKVLSRGGATIQQMNLVRKHVEILKGGGLVQIAHPAKMLTLILSDVIGDDLNFVASGPTVPMDSSSQECLNLLQELGVLSQVPDSVIRVLQDPEAKETAMGQGSASFPTDNIQNVLVGTNTISLNAARQRAEELGYSPIILSNTLDGDAEDTGRYFAALGKFIATENKQEQPFRSAESEAELARLGLSESQILAIKQLLSGDRRPLCVLAGGETTVHVRGSGKGGRNQQMALAAAMAMHDEHSILNLPSSVHFLSAGTDGQDGPTEAAGAIADIDVITKAREEGLDPGEYLHNNDTFTFYKQLGGGQYHIMTGFTGTNVMDVQVLLVVPPSP